MAKLAPDDIALGELAFCAGKPMSANPYIVGTTPWGRWHYGWTKAQLEAAK